MNLPSVKILYTSAYAQMVGGGQESLLQLLKRLDRSKFTPLVVCPGKGEFSTKVAALNAETRILPFPKLKHTKVWRPASTIIKLRRLILKEKIGIVHCDTLYTTVYAGLACLGTRVPAIFHARTAESGGFLDRIAFILSKNIICVSRAVAGRFATFSGYEKKTRVIYNGVDTDEFKSDSFRELAKKRYHIPPANKVIGYCGQLIEGKGVGT